MTSIPSFLANCTRLFLLSFFFIINVFIFSQSVSVCCTRFCVCVCFFYFFCLIDHLLRQLDPSVIGKVVCFVYFVFVFVFIVFWRLYFIWNLAPVF